MPIRLERLNDAIMKRRNGGPLTNFENINSGIALGNIQRLSGAGVRLTGRAWRNLMEEGIVYRVLGSDQFGKYTTLADLDEALAASLTAISWDGIHPPAWPKLKPIDIPAGRFRYILDV
jgi:hypothetical protein